VVVLVGARTIAADPIAPHRLFAGLPSQDSPVGLVHRFQALWEHLALDDYAALLTDDYRFVSLEPDLAPEIRHRDDEIAAAEHLFHGFTRAGRWMPPAIRITVDLDPFTVGPDPDQPNADRYQRVVIPRRTLRVEFEDGTAWVSEMRDELRIVRGDVAALVPGQRADADHWYIAEWKESWAPIEEQPRQWQVIGPIYEARGVLRWILRPTPMPREP
jgi:hypothetical protein